MVSKQYVRRLHAQRAQHPVNLLQTVRGERLRAEICDDLELLSSEQRAAHRVDIRGGEAFERACGDVASAKRPAALEPAGTKGRGRLGHSPQTIRWT